MLAWRHAAKQGLCSYCRAASLCFVVQDMDVSTCIVAYMAAIQYRNPSSVLASKGLAARLQRVASYVGPDRLLQIRYSAWVAQHSAVGCRRLEPRQGEAVGQVTSASACWQTSDMQKLTEVMPMENMRSQLACTDPMASRIMGSRITLYCHATLPSSLPSCVCMKTQVA